MSRSTYIAAVSCAVSFALLGAVAVAPRGDTIGLLIAIGVVAAINGGGLVYCYRAWRAAHAARQGAEMVAAIRASTFGGEWPGLGALTWTCHVCGAVRPDDKISVYTRTLVSPTGVEIRSNTRYCNDRGACIAGAPAVHWITIEE